MFAVAMLGLITLVDGPVIATDKRYGIDRRGDVRALCDDDGSHQRSCQ